MGKRFSGRDPGKIEDANPEKERDTKRDYYKTSGFGRKDYSETEPPRTIYGSVFINLDAKAAD